MVPTHILTAAATTTDLPHRHVSLIRIASMLLHARRMATICFLTTGIAGPAHAFHDIPGAWKPYEWKCEVVVPWVRTYHFRADSEAACRSEVEAANSSSVYVTPFRCISYAGGQSTACAVLYSWAGPPGTAGSASYYYVSRNIIKLSPADSSVEPGNTTTLLARVYDQNNQPVPNVNVILEVTVGANSGGHMHDVNRPKGTVSPSAGSTGPDGSGLVVTFTAPASAGDHTITAKCADDSCGEATASVWVGVKDLVPLSGVSGAYRLVGDKPAHPGNSYLSSQASQVISSIAGAYQILVQFDVPPTPVLHLNDASIERGGIFDINSTWARPHAEHCRGTVIDVRANDAPGAIPARYHSEFELISRFYNADPMWEVPPAGSVLLPPLWEQRHYHVRLLGEEGLSCPW